MTSLGWRDVGTVLLSKADAERRRGDTMRGDGTREEPVFQGAVMSRRRERVRRVDKEKERDQEEAAAFNTEPEEVGAKRPESRIKWLQKALILAGKQQLKLSILYDVVMLKKFTAGVTDKQGAMMKAMLQANSHLFSAKQSRKMLNDDESPFFSYDVKALRAKAEKSRDKKRKKRAKSSTSPSSSSELTSSSEEEPPPPKASRSSKSSKASGKHDGPAEPPARRLDPRVFARGAADDM